MRCFCDDLTASTTAKILSINRNTINAYFTEFRVKILENSIKEHSKEFGIFELDESYFGGRRIRGKRGARSCRKNPSFWFAETKWKSVCNGRAELFKRSADACNSRQDAGRYDNLYRRVECVRWVDFERVRSLLHVSQSKRICTWERSCKWHRKFLEFCKKTACKIQRIGRQNFWLAFERM